MEKGIKKKAFKLFIENKMKEGQVEGFAVDPDILEKAVCKHGREMRKATDQIVWEEKNADVVIDFYNNFGKEPEATNGDEVTNKETTKLEKTKTATTKKKPAVVKPMKNNTTTKSGASKKAKAKIPAKKTASAKLFIKGKKKAAPKKKSTTKK